MDHLDLAGIMTTPPQWNMPVFDQQDAIYLSSSRQMLEPIMEETSEDEEYALNSWNQYDAQLSDGGGGAESTCSGSAGGTEGRGTAGGASFWSSAESDTGSVIRVEITKDNDSTSERDFLCPAKRPRRCEETLAATAALNEDEVVLRRPMFGDLKNNSLERFLNYDNFSRDSWGATSQQRSSLGSRRGTGGGFDDFYSDSDSLSYNSLSRSSSLIQFESLERQLLLQEQHASMTSLGNSSPSLLSFEAQNAEDASSKQSANSANNSANNSRRGSQSSLLKKYESLDGRLHQTYYDLDKLNFDDMEVSNNTENFNRPANLKLSNHMAELRSDSESSSEGSDGSSRPQSVLSPCDSQDNEFLKKFHRNNSQQSKKGKSSAENLSEDSGYGEPLMGFGLLRRSKSQNLCKNYEKFSEEDEEMDSKQMEHKSLVSTAENRAEHQTGVVLRDHKELNGSVEREERAQQLNEKHSSDGGEFKNTIPNYYQPPTVLQTPPTSPLLDYMRHKQRSATHSPSPASSEVSTSSTASSKNSGCSTATSSSLSTNSAASSSASSVGSSATSSSAGSSTSSATTCASKASFTWLMPSSKSTRVYDREENPLQISLNDLRERKTSSNDDDASSPTHQHHHHQHHQQHQPSQHVAKRNHKNNHPNAQHLYSSVENVAPPSPPTSPAATGELKQESSVNAHGPSKGGSNITLKNKANPHENCVNEEEGQTVKNSSEIYYETVKKDLKLITDFSNFHTTSSPNLTLNPENQCLDNTSVSEVKTYVKPQRISEFHDFNIQQDFRHPFSESPSREQHNLCLKSIRIGSSSTSPPAYYSSESDYSPPGTRRHFENFMQHWPERTSSVPNELNKLGRQKKKIKRTRNKIAGVRETTDNELRFASTHDLDTSPEVSDEEEKEDLKCLKRSSSWCFDTTTTSLSSSGVTTTTQQETEFPYNPTALESQNLAVLHQSYHNLALLDLESGNMSANNPAAKAKAKVEHRISSDYEAEIVCKNNFLLDELSAHYDKTASILNDRPVNDVTDGAAAVAVPSAAAAAAYKPKAPVRRRSSNSSYSEKSDTDEEHVQHVQLVIRKPPARQKRQQQDKQKSNSLTQDFSFTAIMQAKTFDQDPTMLKTSYAQSLEKCNFDCKEISNQDLTRTRSIPKRRFHSQANYNKKKNMVSSTPNLNAYQQDEEEIEDDMFVSSAHNSMHQLPMSQQKPLGILLPAGSRTSFSKEVSFCPVVSKYSWQEQSSEECNDGSEVVVAPAAGCEESDDELLDNSDADVIKNTKENENIGQLYREDNDEPKEAVASEESLMKEKYKEVIKELPLKQRSPELEQELYDDKEHDARAYTKSASDEREPENAETLETATAEEPQLPTLLQHNEMATPTRESGTSWENETECETPVIATASTVSLTTNVNNETLTAKPDTTTTPVTETSSSSATTPTHEQQQESIEATANKRIKPTRPTTIVVARPISIQLPILSEPPINRAHHILYASQQMLDNFQRHQQTEDYEHYYKSQSVQNLNRMSDGRMNNNNGGSAAAASSNNNNELMKSKFKADEKHPNSKGFLSRFTNGFRFSMRRNKKKLPPKDGAPMEEGQTSPQTAADSNVVKKSNGVTAKSKNKHDSKSGSGSKQQQPDYIYIPLKGPLPEKYETGYFESHQQNNGHESTATNGNAKSDINKNATVQAKKGAKSSKTVEEQQQHKVTGKPPLPPQQQQQQQQQQINLQRTQSAHSAQHPREHHQQQQQIPQIQVGHSRFYTHELNSSPSSSNTLGPAGALPSSATQDFLQSERNHAVDTHQSFANNDTVNISNDTSGDMTSSTTAAGYDFTSPSRATVSQKTQMFNNLSSSRNSAVEPKIGLIETNLDTHETVITGKTRSLINIGPNSNQGRYAGNKRLHHHVGGGVDGGGRTDDTGDYYDDNDDDEVVVRPDGSVVVIKNAGSNGGGSASQAQIASVRRPHKSMEFLLDKENQKDVMPPENELQKSHDHNPAALSEHQLRIQASLQRLNIPDWFRQYNQNQKSPEGAGSAGGAAAYKPGNFTRKRTQDSGRWVGLNSKTTSLSSLGSQRSDRSPLLLSPSAHSHHGGQTTAAGGHHGGGHHHGVGGVAGTTGASGAAFSRWSTSHLNSSQTSPSVSQRGSFTRGGPINSSFISVNSGNSVLRNSMRQPYLGWRSQEKLSQRTAHERLASSLLAQQQRTSPTTQMASSGGSAANRKLQPVTPEIQSSIKEVTSAIVHYVNDQTNQQRSRSTSPNSRKCWLESSFVGIRPLDSPQTPVIENTPLIAAVAAANANLRPLLSGSNINNNNNSFQIANHNFGQIVGSGVGGGGVTANASAVTAAFLNSSAPLTGNDLQQLTRMNGGLNNGSTSSSSGGGGIIHYPVGESKRKAKAFLI